MNISVIAPKINLDKFWNIPIYMTLPSAGSTAKYKFEMGNKDVYIYGVDVEIIDANGQLISDNNVARDSIRLGISNNRCEGYQLNPIPLKALDNMHKFGRFQGWFMKKELDYTFEITANNVPNKGNYPIQVAITLLGYEIE